jgi:alpha-L-fucosidase 2
MKKSIVLLLAIAGFISCSNRSEITVNQLPMKWSYNIPATKYWESLPIGTGRFVAMIPGSADTEVIAFNDETLYTGGPYNPNPANGLKRSKKSGNLFLPAIMSMPTGNRKN